MHEYYHDFVCSVWTFAFFELVTHGGLDVDVYDDRSCHSPVLAVVADCKKRRRRASTPLHSKSISFKDWNISELDFLISSTHISRFFPLDFWTFASSSPSQPSTLISSYIMIIISGNNFISDGHFLNRFCVAKPKWVNMWINLLMHTSFDMAIKIF